MAIKTRLEILEDDYNSAQAQIVENEVNITLLESRLITAPPGNAYNDLTKLIETKKANIKSIEKVLEIVTNMMNKEKENGGKKV